VRHIVRAAAARGAAVFLNSHLLSEDEQVCDRVAIVDHGRVVASGALDDVLGQSETQVVLTGITATDLPAFARFGAASLDHDRLSIRPMDEDQVPELVNLLVSMGGRIREVRSGRSSLEQRFVELVSRDRSIAGTSAGHPEQPS
jgi:ABC-2 type transport system ATP-binding protein